MINLIKNKTATLALSICCIVLFSPSINAQKSDKKKRIQTTVASNGAKDREYWSQLLYKMSYPVIHNLAQETLKQNMPLEQLPNYGDCCEKGYNQRFDRKIALAVQEMNDNAQDV
jgi:hypothetical protein